jgi:hypothetical protein
LKIISSYFKHQDITSCLTFSGVVAVPDLKQRISYIRTAAENERKHPNILDPAKLPCKDWARLAKQQDRQVIGEFITKKQFFMEFFLSFGRKW